MMNWTNNEMIIILLIMKDNLLLYIKLIEEKLIVNRVIEFKI